MADRPYHHGSLRAVLLTEAERVLREQGIEALSLRDLARQAGVSHAAPRRHFPDRQALLAALAEAGLTRLDAEVRAAIADAGPDYVGQLTATATAFVRFATDDAALMDLMFTAKNAGGPAEGSGHAGPAEAAARLFAVIDDLIRQGQRAGALPAGDPGRLQLLFAAMVQGIAVLVTAGRIAPTQVDGLVADAVALFTQAGVRSGAQADPGTGTRARPGRGKAGRASGQPDIRAEPT